LGGRREHPDQTVPRNCRRSILLEIASFLGFLGGKKKCARVAERMRGNHNICTTNGKAYHSRGGGVGGGGADEEGGKSELHLDF